MVWRLGPVSGNAAFAAKLGLRTSLSLAFGIPFYLAAIALSGRARRQLFWHPLGTWLDTRDGAQGDVPVKPSGFFGFWLEKAPSLCKWVSPGRLASHAAWLIENGQAKKAFKLAQAAGGPAGFLLLLEQGYGVEATLRSAMGEYFSQNPQNSMKALLLFMEEDPYNEARMLRNPDTMRRCLEALEAAGLLEKEQFRSRAAACWKRMGARAGMAEWGRAKLTVRELNSPYGRPWLEDKAAGMATPEGVWLDKLERAGYLPPKDSWAFEALAQNDLPLLFGAALLGANLDAADPASGKCLAGMALDRKLAVFSRALAYLGADFSGKAPKARLTYAQKLEKLLPPPEVLKNNPKLTSNAERAALGSGICAAPQKQDGAEEDLGLLAPEAGQRSRPRL